MMTNSSPFYPVQDDAEVTKILHLADKILDRPFDLSSSWLRANNWAAVPVEGCVPLQEEEADCLALWFQKIGALYLWGHPAEEFEGEPACYLVQGDKSGLLAFTQELHYATLLLIPEDLRFTFLLGQDFHILAGSAGLVTDGLGKSIAEAREEFLRYAETIGGRLPSVAKRYESFSGAQA